MNNIFFILSFFLCSSSLVSAQPQALVQVKLFPMGSFELSVPVESERPLRKADKGGSAVLKAPVRLMKTGISLRDKHLREKLEAKKYPFVIVDRIRVTGASRGTAQIKIMKVTKNINFDFKELPGALAEASFSLSLKEFEITGISYKGVGVDDKVEVTVTVPVQG